VGRSRDSSVGIIIGYGLDDRGSDFESRKGQEFSLLHVVQAGSGVHPKGAGGPFLGVKAAGARS
jgi:hypothetical protein